MSSYTVWGYVIAHNLPDYLVLGSATIRKEPNNSKLLPTRQRPSGPHLGQAEAYYGSVAPYTVNLNSRWTIGFEKLSALNADEAFAYAEYTLAPRILAALEAVAGSPAFVTLVGIEDLSGPTVAHSPAWSRTGTMRIYDPTLLSETETDAVAVRIVEAVVSTDPTGQQCAKLLAAANTMYFSYGGEGYLRASALFNVVKLFEAVAFAVDKETAQAHNLYDKQAEIVQELERVLAEPQSTKHKVSAVNRHNRELQNLKGKTTKERLRRAGTLLGLDTSSIKEVVKLWDYRSTHLGHGGKTPEIADDMIAGALTLARRVVLSYAHWVEGGSPRYAPQDIAS